MFKTFSQSISVAPKSLSTQIKIFEDVFSEELVTQILDFVDVSERAPATVGTTGDFVRADRETRDAYQIDTRSPTFLKMYKDILEGTYKCLHDFLREENLLSEYNFEKLVPDGGIGLICYDPGSCGYVPHYDATPRDWKCADRIFSIVIYWNDDFSGGDLYFPDINKRIKVKQNTVAVFPSNVLFRHASLPLGDGRKVISPAWFGYEIPQGADYGPII